MASAIESLKMYVIGIEFPASLNDPSPAKLIPLVGEWRTEDACQPRRRIARMHRQLGLILRYDPVTSVAVVFLGSSNPTQPQRYLPWLGTPRLPFQTLQVLVPAGEDGADFRNFPGYLNFTHAIRVLVVQPSVVNTISNPGPATVTDIFNRVTNPPEEVHIRLPLSQMDVLRDLHSAYWNGLRYSVDGTELGGGGGGGGARGPGVSAQTEQGANVSVTKQGGDVTPPRASVSIQGAGVSNHEDRAAKASMKLAQALAWEHFRNQQITMVEGDGGDEDEDAFDLDRLPRCVLAPLTEMDFQSEFSMDESSVGFPWEMNLGVDSSVQLEC